MSTETVTTFLALLAVVALVVVVVTACTAVFSKLRGSTPRWALEARAAVAPVAIPLAWAVALTCTLGSLYLSEVAKFPPCILCWYQRIAMYPLVVILAVAALRRDRAVKWYVVPMALIGIGISIYHYLIERFPDSVSFSCSADVPCSTVWVWKFHFLSIPAMAGLGFALITTLVLLGGSADHTATADPAPADHDPSDPSDPSDQFQETSPMSEKRQKGVPYGYSSTPSSSGGSRTGIYVIGAVVALVVVAGIVALVTTSESGDSAAEAAVQEQAPVTVTGEALPSYPSDAGLFADPATDPAVGMTPPTLKGEDFQGEPVTIEPGSGPMVVIFAAHWCPHCQEEIPLIREWIDSGQLPEDVEINLVSTGVKADQNNYPPSDWLAEEGWTEQILLDNPDQAAGNAWGLTGYPYIVFVGADGKVVQRASGELPIDQFGTFVDNIAV